MKRCFDILLALAGLLLLAPLMLVLSLLVRVDSPGPIIFKQTRIGKNFRPFRIYKFRSMVDATAPQGSTITVGADPRITRVGRFLRKLKLDELPQLFNVLKGDMSFVGPRPEVPEFVELFKTDFAEVLKVRPGITDLGSLKYRDEAALLERAQDSRAEYINHVLPDKIQLAKQYIAQSSLVFDFKVIMRTLGAILR
jgi:lipopolysaccharide/colanic/teichoic acid biosynthesis glycosyltransferase